MRLVLQCLASNNVFSYIPHQYISVHRLCGLSSKQGTRRMLKKLYPTILEMVSFTPRRHCRNLARSPKKKKQHLKLSQTQHTRGGQILECCLIWRTPLGNPNSLTVDKLYLENDILKWVSVRRKVWLNVCEMRCPTSTKITSTAFSPDI